MTDGIRDLKCKIMKHLDGKLADMNRANVHEIGELVDMVKDLSEAEKECWEAAYYRSITDAMEEYDERESESEYDEIIELVSDKYHDLTPDERKKMKNKILTKLGSM